MSSRVDKAESQSAVSGDLDGLAYKATNPTYTGIINPIVEISLGEEHPLVTRVSQDKLCFAVGLDTGAIKMYTFSGEKVKMVYHLPAPDPDTLSCTDIQFVPYKDYVPSEKKHMMVASYASGHLKIWHYTAATPKSRQVASFLEEKILRPNEPRKSIVGKDGKVIVKQNNQIMACSVSLDGSRCITGGEDSVIRVYDLVGKKEIAKCYSTNAADKMDGHVMRICAVLYHPRGEKDDLYSHIFLSAGWDDSIQIWDDRHAHSLWQYYGPHICGSDALDIDAEQNHILVSSWRRDKTILEIWKFNEEVLHEFNEHRDINKSHPNYQQYAKPITKMLQDKNSPSMGYVARWLGPQYILFGGSNLNMLKILDKVTCNTVGMVADLPNGVYSVAFHIPENITEKRPARLSFCSGTKLYLVKLEKK